MKKNFYNIRGVTLIELVIVIIVIGILSAVMAPVAYTSLRAYDNSLGDVVVLDKLRYATERMAREIRAVDYDPVNGFAFANMGANSMTFTRTLYDASGSASQTLVTVGNTGSAVTLAYASPAIGAQVLTDELNGTSGLSFKYLTSDGTTVTSDKRLVRMVQISLNLNHNGSIYPQLTQLQLKNIN